MRSHQPDYSLLTVIGVLLLIGTFTLFDASSVRGETVANDPFFYLKKQALFLAAGLVGFFLAYKINHLFWRRFAFIIIILGFLGMLAVFIPGLGTNLGKGATRWVQLGSLTFQPIEFFKLCLIVYLASFFASKQDKINKFEDTLVPFVVIQGAIILIMLGQSSLGGLLILAAISLGIYFLAGLDLKYILLFGALGTAAVAAFIYFAPYRRERLEAFFHPEADPLGSGYQINQALIGIGSGGFRGVGLGHSRQKFSFLPETMSDSIFAIWAEETGFVGTALLLILIGLFFWRGFSIARNSREMFSKLLAGGITFWITTQFLFNIAANSGLIPLSGIPLPFFSYGGSALVATLAGCGMLLNISKYTVVRR